MLSLIKFQYLLLAAFGFLFYLLLGSTVAAIAGDSFEPIGHSHDYPNHHASILTGHAATVNSLSLIGRNDHGMLNNSWAEVMDSADIKPKAFLEKPKVTTKSGKTNSYPPASNITTTTKFTTMMPQNNTNVSTSSTPQTSTPQTTTHNSTALTPNTTTTPASTTTHLNTTTITSTSSSITTQRPPHFMNNSARKGFAAISILTSIAFLFDTISYIFVRCQDRRSSSMRIP